jgi:nifR3 family TIM-barrel protein
VTAARPAAPELRIGPIELATPVVLAPMAGVTNRAFRRLCRRHGAALLVSEMVNARGFVEDASRCDELTAFDDDETTRSLQLYGTDPRVIGEAVRRLVDRGVDHVDLNLGCPVRKVTRHGGGAAVPARPRLVAAIVGAAIVGGGGIPVTVKMRMGIDDARLTFLPAARAAVSEGAAAIALHARTAAQLYSGAARWDAIGELVTTVPEVPVLGNGDVWSAADALRMQRATGCAGVVVGRGCLGNPWLFRDLTAAFAGGPVPAPPDLGEVCDTILEHAALLAEHLGEARAMLAIRKHVGWYLTGYHVGGWRRRRLMETCTLAALAEELATFDRSQMLPPDQRGVVRGTRRGPQSVTLPHGWLDADAAEPPRAQEAELALSGGA